MSSKSVPSASRGLNVDYDGTFARRNRTLEKEDAQALIGELAAPFLSAGMLRFLADEVNQERLKSQFEMLFARMEQVGR